MNAEQVTAALRVAAAVAEAIKELGEVPSGVLYAQLCGHLDLESYLGVIDTLVKAGLVTNDSHLLKWVGPPVAR